MEIIKNLKSLICAGSKLVLDCLFPLKCLSCYKEGSWVCSECLPKLKINNFQYCIICEGRNLDGRVCMACAEKSYLNGLLVVFDYKHYLVKKLITTFKYQKAHQLKYFLSDYLVDLLHTVFILNLDLEKQDDMVVTFVPLHKKRLIERGFDQANLLSEILAQQLNLNFTQLLVRTRYTIPQVKLSIDERLNNLQGAFKVQDARQSIFNKKVILVDDVVTTGSTMQECARVLKLAGAAEVWGIAIAKG